MSSHPRKCCKAMPDTIHWIMILAYMVMDSIPAPLYHVEVQAVVVDNSDWSDFALVFPTISLPIPYATRVAANSFDPIEPHLHEDRNGSHEYRYTLCKGTITTDVAWSRWDTNEQGDLVRDAATVAVIATDIEAAIEKWETAVRWVANGANIISTTATETEICTDSDSNPVKFISRKGMLRECGVEDALGCVPFRSSDMFLAQTPMRRVGFAPTDQLERTSWDVMANGCSYLHKVVLHESGHAFGLGAGHSKTPQAVMYFSLSGQNEPFCGPQVYDVVAMMVNYQSR